MTRPESHGEITLSLPESFAHACQMLGPIKIEATNRATGERKEIQLDQPYAIIGRLSAASIHLEDPSVSQCHAYLQVIDGLPYCLDLASRNGVIWEDGSRNRGWIMTGATVRIGVFDLKFQFVVDEMVFASIKNLKEPLKPTPQDSLNLVTTSLELYRPADVLIAKQELHQPITLLGQHPHCQVRFLDEEIGYFQCAFVNTREGIWCVDFLSRRGLLINGRYSRLAHLRDGDMMELGKVTLLVVANRTNPEQSLVRQSELTGRSNESLATIPKQVAESVDMAIAPVREMMDQFQQCFLTMAQMFTTMQQGQATMMSDQMKLIQDLAKDLRDLRAEVKADLGTKTPETAQVPQPTQIPAVKPPTPTVQTPEELSKLADAHLWFMDRLSKFSGGDHKRKGS